MNDELKAVLAELMNAGAIAYDEDRLHRLFPEMRATMHSPALLQDLGLHALGLLSKSVKGTVATKRAMLDVMGAGRHG